MMKNTECGKERYNFGTFRIHARECAEESQKWYNMLRLKKEELCVVGVRKRQKVNRKCQQ